MRAIVGAQQLAQSPTPTMSRALSIHSTNIDTPEAWIALAESIFKMRRSNHKSNFTHLKRVFDGNKELILTLCPNFWTILSFVLADKFELRVLVVGEETSMSDWTMEDCRRIGCSLETLIRKRRNGRAAIEVSEPSEGGI